MIKNTPGDEQENVFRIPETPTCAQLEKLNSELGRIQDEQTIILVLAQDVSKMLFAEGLVTQIISHLSKRSGKLVVRDQYYGHPDDYEQQFLARIDRVAALIYSHLYEPISFESLPNHTNPADLLKSLMDRLLKAGAIQSEGLARTLIAVDPDRPRPPELQGTRGQIASFMEIIKIFLEKSAYQQTKKTPERERREQQLSRLMYEIYQNTIDHGRYKSDEKLIPGIRYLHLNLYWDSELLTLIERSSGFPTLQSFFSRKSDKKSSKRFVALSVGDVGQGICSHYVSAVDRQIDTEDERLSILKELVFSTLSSKLSIPGAGRGLPNAIAALKQLNAFFYVRTEEFCLYADFADPLFLRTFRPTLESVIEIGSIAPISGTQINVLFELPK